MGSLYNKKKNIDILTNQDSDQKLAESSPYVPQKQEETVPSAPSSVDVNIPQYQERAFDAMKLVDDVVMKNYLVKLDKYEVAPLQNNEMNYDDIILFKINKMVYDKEENATDKFISVISSMTCADCSIALIIDGFEDRTDFYLGVKSNDKSRPWAQSQSLCRTIEGNFPGVKLEDISTVEKGASCSKKEILLRGFLEGKDSVRSVSSCVGVPSEKNEDNAHNNENYIQGVEKFALAMQGKRYTAVIIAQNNNSQTVQNLRSEYENLYTELSAVSGQQLSYSTNESLAEAVSRTKGETVTDTNTSTDGTSTTKGTSTGITDTTSTSHTSGVTKTHSFNSSIFGGMIFPFSLGGSVGYGYSKGKSESDTKGESHGVTNTTSESLGTNHSDSISKAIGTSLSETLGTTTTTGSQKSFTVNVKNKHIEEVMKRIDKQLERINSCESSGLWSTSAYFMTYGIDNSSATAASIFRSIMSGENSGVETSAITTWNKDKTVYDNVSRYVTTFSHPVVKYQEGNIESYIMPSSFLSSKEVAMMIGLPRKSVPGLPVVEHISLAKEVVRLDGNKSDNCLQLGNIFDQGIEREANKVTLDVKSLCSHTFVTGSTGCGKSNTIYYLISQIRKQPNAPKFLIIEPAKGEYKNVFGNENIYGTNPLITPLLRINPFRFPKGVHVLEHIDKLIEIFNVCWPMYAAMPAILKEAILNAYEDCGWDLYSSQNKYSDELFPSFADLMNELVISINNSAYSEEVKGNYQGSLVTRVKSLTNGINKEIFSNKELGDEKLFDENVIVDLSRIGSQETKSLIMGILIMRLSEYRANSNIESNSNLRHVTILEEAHNILKRCSQEQSMEGSNVAGKSVEMISNAIAEMRTYGEGFVIVDQSPGAVDISAIRNTNTKIIMRLPDEADRKVAGKSAAMQDNQIDEISKLPTGVAVVYQNDWECPVLCKIAKFEDNPIPFQKSEDSKGDEQSIDIRTDVVKLLLKSRVLNSEIPDVDKIKTCINLTDWSTANKWALYEALADYENLGGVNVGADENFERLSSLISEVVSLRSDVMKLANTAKDFQSLTQGLFALIKKSLSELPEPYYKELSHCLMCDYSQANETRMKVYSAWLKSVKPENN